MNLDDKAAIQIANDPAYVARLLHMEPEPEQAKMFEAIAKHNRVSICSGHGVGKTAYLAIIIIWFMLSRYDCRVLFTSTKEDQLKYQIIPEVTLWLNKGPADICNEFIIGATNIYRASNPKGSFAHGQVAKVGQSESLQGAHHEHLLQIVDESSAVSDEHHEAILSTCTGEDNKLLLSSNPTRRTGYFVDSQKPNSPYERLQFSSLDSNLVSQIWIDEIARKYGISSNVYRVRVLGKFPTTDDDALILYDWIEKATERSGGIERGPMIMGVDPGRSVDGDASGIVVRSGDRVLHAEQIWIKDVVKVGGLAIRIKNQLIEAYPGISWSHFAVDVIGLGAGTADSLRDQGEEVVDVNVSLPSHAFNPATGQKEAGTLRDELWLDVRDWLKEGGSIRGLEQDILEVLQAELSAPKYSPGADGSTKVESKKEMKKRGIQSPNLADALCCTFAAKGGGFWMQSIGG